MFQIDTITSSSSTNEITGARFYATNTSCTAIAPLSAFIEIQYEYYFGFRRKRDICLPDDGHADFSLANFHRRLQYSIRNL